MSAKAAFHAVNRFGLGAAPGDVAAASSDPRGWVLAQIGPQALPARLKAFRSAVSLEALVRGQAAAKQSAKKANQAKPVPAPGESQKDIYLAESAARTLAGAETKSPFAERWARFWSNHFTVSVARPRVAALAGAFEREAIRPQAFGRFHDMLRAATRHPAMLYYLDNTVSVGPNSQAGKRRQKGLNENLAREILELHTLGVDGGYGQQDVEAFARILTGWTVGNPRQGTADAFHFAAAQHEPGDKRLLGRTYRGGGVEEGEAALKALAEHPATARFLATKLARHFIADDPPPAAVQALAEAFAKSGGSLAAVARALVERPEAWENPLAKAKTPDEMVVGLLRATGLQGLDDKQLVRALTLMGQAPFSASSPAGWPDRAEAWIGPEALVRRLEWLREAARRLVRHAPTQPDLVDRLVGPGASAATWKAVNQAGDQAETLFLLLASREFQRR